LSKKKTLTGREKSGLLRLQITLENTGVTKGRGGRRTPNKKGRLEVKKKKKKKKKKNQKTKKKKKKTKKKTKKGPGGRRVDQQIRGTAR